MEPRRRSRRRTLGLGVDRLVAVAILELLCDIGRQGHEADLVEDVVDILVFLAVVGEADDAVPFLHHINDLACQHSLSKHHTVTEAGTLAGLDKALPGIQIMLAKQEQFNARFGSALGVAVESRGNDLGVVDDQHVLGSDVVENIIKMLVGQAVIVSVDHQKAGCVTLFCGVLGDLLFGEVIEKVRRSEVGHDAFIDDSLGVLFAHGMSFL